MWNACGGFDPVKKIDKYARGRVRIQGWALQGKNTDDGGQYNKYTEGHYGHGYADTQPEVVAMYEQCKESGIPFDPPIRVIRDQIVHHAVL